MPILDFNSLVICNENFDITSLTKAIKHFRSCGIRNFIISCGVDVRDQSPFTIRILLSQTKKEVSTIKVRGAKIRFIPHIHIHEGTARHYFTPHLKAWGSDIILLEAPLAPNAYWFDTENHHYIYVLGLRPVFLGYDMSLTADTPTVAEKLFKSPNVDFCFDLRQITMAKFEFRLHQSMSYGSTLIPCISNDFKSYRDIIKRFEKLRARMGDDAYLKLCRHINLSCQALWERI